MKFGGTSVGSVDSILQVKRIVEAADEPVVVVVSALGGITDQLIRTGQTAALGDVAYRTCYEAIARRHADVVQGLMDGPKRQEVMDGINALLVQGLTGDYFNVMGLPVAALARHLREMGVTAALSGQNE